MQMIPFTKMVASGNDFIVVDNRDKAIQNPSAFARRICRSHLGVGADGVLLIEKSKKADFKMRIVNSDGSEAEACGNGFRCIALFAKQKLGFPDRFRFESLSGLIEAELQGRKIQVQLIKPKNFQQEKVLEVLGHRLHYFFINTGVPHVVIFVEGLSKMNVQQLGKAIRKHPQFAPKGTNVNFVEVKGRQDIDVRTYERGVEVETLACGTGSTASAVVSSLAGYTKPPVRVKTSGGEILLINFQKKGNKISRTTLQGEAHFVYEGNYINNGRA